MAAATFLVYTQGFYKIKISAVIMYFEGTKQSIKNLYQKAKDVAESYGKKEIFNITDNSSQDASKI